MANSRETVNSVQIASPCSMSWDAMEGDERVRYCSACRLNVYNLSAMDVEEAAQLLAEDNGKRLCIRLYRRRDGTVLTQDCPVGLRAAIERRVTAIAGSIGAAFGLLTGLFLRPPTAATTAVPLMGDVAPVRTPLQLPVLPTPPAPDTEVQPEMGALVASLGDVARPPAQTKPSHETRRR